MVMKRLMSLDEMEPIAKEATRLALSEYPEPSKGSGDRPRFLMKLKQ